MTASLRLSSRTRLLRPRSKSLGPRTVPRDRSRNPPDDDRPDRWAEAEFIMETLFEELFLRRDDAVHVLLEIGRRVLDEPTRH